MAYTDYLNTVQKIYIAYYQRPADPAGLIYWAKRLDLVNGNLNEIINAFATSAESQALYGTINNDTIETFVTNIYQALFNRTPDDAGKKYYVDGFKSGKFTPGSIALDILNGAQNDDAVAIMNKLEVANRFTKAIDPELDGLGPFKATYSGNADAVEARNMLKEVTFDQSTVKNDTQVKTFIQEKIADASDPIKNEQVSGQTFTLTNSAVTGSFDNLTGTSGNDTFVAGNGTLETSDVINGGGGTDKLETTSVNNVTVSPTLTSVEQIYARTFGDHDGTYELNLANATGVQEAWAWNIEDTTANDKNDLLKFSGLSKAVTAGIKGGASVNANRADVEWAYNDVTGAADEATLVVDGANVDDVTIAGVETLNIKTQGANSTIGNTLTVVDATKLVITGDKNLTIAQLNVANANNTIDASAMTGNLSVKFENQNVNVTYKGSKGDDTVDLNGTLAAGDDIDGGTGTNTIKGITPAAQLTAATGKLLKNFQVFDAAGAAAGTYDMDFIVGSGTTSTINALKVSGALGGAVTIDNLAKGADVTITANTGNNLTVNQKGADAAGSNSDTLNFILQAPATGGNITVANLIAPNVETITIKSMETSGVTGGHTLTAGTFTHAQTVKFEGNEQLTVTNLTVVAASLIDASGMTDKFIMTNAFTLNNAVASMIKGGSKDDTLRIDEANVATNSVVIGGGGKDSIFIVDAGANNKTIIVKYTAQSCSTGSAWDNINGFVAGAGGGDGDKIDISFLSFTGAAATIFNGSAKVTLNQAGANSTFDITAANATGFFNNAGADRAVAYATGGTDTFVFVDANKDGNWSAADDMAILLVGVNGANLTAVDNFIFA